MALTTNLGTVPNRFRQDPIPKIRTAGKNIVQGNEGADYCVRADVFGQMNPGTPDAIKKYRKTTQNDPGKIQVHPGLQDDLPNKPDGFSFGKKSFESEQVNYVIKSQNLAGLADKFNDIKEGKYATSIKEPLSKGYSRQYQWPEGKIDANGNFGQATKYSDPAKNLMYPQGGDKEEKTLHNKQYIKTHGNYATGEQRQRDYDWKVDPKTHQFGYGEKKLLNGAAKSICPERIEGGFPKTVIVKKTVEDWKGVANDQFGQVKNLGQGLTKEIMTQRTFGVKNYKDGGNWNAAQCMTGDASSMQLLPDKDLGKSIKANCSNNVRKPEDAHRSFGAPSIRTDIPLKVKKSVADYQNYGDEPEAVDLLFPQTFLELGVGETDFQMMRPRQDIRQLFERIGYTYKIGKFNAIYNKAKEILGSPDHDMVSVRSFMMAVQELHNIE